MRTEVLAEDQAVINLAFPIEAKIYEAGSQIVPASATITVKDPSGTAQVSAAMSVSATGILTYSLAMAYTATLWEDAIIEIDYVVLTIHYKTTFFFDVVNQMLKRDVLDADLTAYEPALAAGRWAEQSSFEPQIVEAFKIVKRDIKNKGKRPTMLIDGRQVRELIILKALEIIFRAWAKSPDDVQGWKSTHYEEAYAKALLLIIIKYDVDEDADVDDADAQQAFSQVTLIR